MGEFSKKHQSAINQPSPSHQSDAVLISTQHLNALREKGKKAVTVRTPESLLSRVDELASRLNLTRQDIYLLGLCRMLEPES